MNEPVGPIFRRPLIGTGCFRGIPFDRSGHVKYQCHARTLPERLGLGKGVSMMQKARKTILYTR